MSDSEQSHDGELTQLEDGRWQLRFKRLLAHPQEKVWRALTEPEHLAHWFPTTIEGERAAGASLRYSFPGGQAPPFTGEMLTFEPQSLVELSWGGDIVRLELRSVPEGTELTLLDTLEELGKAARDGAGWHTCLEALEACLHEDVLAGDLAGRWNEAHARYAELFGPEAATLGPPKRFQP
ncbi:MAG TPA: SRPBCC domain-containing protein [Solirubrobacteraceae bacterium]|jgi:uncharacterized protein YndB with AHSA1/START domain